MPPQENKMPVLKNAPQETKCPAKKCPRKKTCRGIKAIHKKCYARVRVSS